MWFFLFFLYSLNFFFLFKFKLITLINLEILFMSVCVFILLNNLDSDGLSLFISLILLTFTVLDSVFGVSLLVNTSHNSSFFSSSLAFF